MDNNEKKVILNEIEYLIFTRLRGLVEPKHRNDQDEARWEASLERFSGWGEEIWTLQGIIENKRTGDFNLEVDSFIKKVTEAIKEVVSDVADLGDSEARREARKLLSELRDKLLSLQDSRS
jgi:hypothetical protein